MELLQQHTITAGRALPGSSDPWDALKGMLTDWLAMLKTNLSGHVRNAREGVKQAHGPKGQSLSQGHFHLFTQKMRRNRCLKHGLPDQWSNDILEKLSLSVCSN